MAQCISMSTRKRITTSIHCVHISDRVTSLSVHDSFGTKGWTLSVHDDFGTYEINFGTCAFCCTTSVHAKYHFGTSLCRYRGNGNLRNAKCENAKGYFAKRRAKRSVIG